jgi:hypothetical protein
MPELVDRLQMMMAAIEQQNLAVNARQIASQEAFHGKAAATYARLASSVERSLKESVADSARAASAALQPVMEATMAGLARETASLHATVTHGRAAAVGRAVERFRGQHHHRGRHLEPGAGGTAAFERGAGPDSLRTSLHRFTETFEQRSAGLLEGVSARLDATAGSVSASVERSAVTARARSARRWRVTTSRLWPRPQRPSSSIRLRCCAPWASRRRTCRANWHRGTSNGSRSGPRRSVRWPLR